MKNKLAIKKTFKLSDVMDFLRMSNDNNKIHYEKEYAKNTTIFKGRILPGMLTASLIGGLITKNFGQGTIYLNQELNFVRPAYIDNEVIAEITITSKHVSKPIYYLKTTCYNEDMQELITGKAIIMISKI